MISTKAKVIYDHEPKNEISPHIDAPVIHQQGGRRMEDWRQRQLSGVGNVWGWNIFEVLLIAEVNVTFTAVVWTQEVLKIVEDKIPEALEASVVLCEVVRPLPLESKWRLVRHGEDVCVVCRV
jgi:hypothetical protein